MKRQKTIRVFLIIVFLVLFSMIMLRIYENQRLTRAAKNFQRQAGPINSQDYKTKDVRDSENLATWLAGGVQGLVIENKERTELISPMYDVQAKSWTPEQVEKLKKILVRNDAAIRLLQNSVQFTGSSFSLNYSEGAEMSLPQPKLLYYLQASKLLTCKARLHLLEQNYQQAAETSRILERIAASLEHEPLMITGLVGHVAEKSYYLILHELLQISDSSFLDLALADLRHIKAMAQPLPRILALEGSITYQSFQQELPSELEFTETRFQLLPWIYRVNKRGVIADALEFDTNLVMQSKLPAKIWIENAASPESGMSTKTLYRGLFRENIYSAIERYQGVEAARLLANIAVRLSIEADRTGKYPPLDSLQLESVVSPYTGETVTYVVSSNGSATVAFPESDRFWLRKREEFLAHIKPLFTWQLPVPE